MIRSSKLLKTLLVAVVILLVFSTTSLAALKVVDSETEARYMEIVRSSVEGEIEITESWVREFQALNKDVYVIYTLVDGQKAVIYIDMDTDSIITEETFDDLVTTEAQENESNPTFRITSTKDTNDEDSSYNEDIAYTGIANEEITRTEDNSKYLFPTAMVLLFAGGIFTVKKRAKKS